MKNLVNLILVLCLAGTSNADQLAIHGMLLFGENTTYISHLPMFHVPHDYQLLAQVDLSDLTNSSTLAKWQQAKQTSALFTIVPKPMDLTKVIDGTITFFPVDIYQGHFERGGTLIGPAIVTVKDQLIKSKIVKTNGPSLDFLVFGQSGEYYLIHMIRGQPTYDAIYKATSPTTTIFPPCTRLFCPDPYDLPISDDALPLTITATDLTLGAQHPVNTQIGTPFSHRVTVSNPIYIEYNELAH